MRHQFLRDTRANHAEKIPYIIFKYRSSPFVNGYCYRAKNIFFFYCYYYYYYITIFKL